EHGFRRRSPRRRNPCGAWCLRDTTGKPVHTVTKFSSHCQLPKHSSGRLGQTVTSRSGSGFRRTILFHPAPSLSRSRVVTETAQPVARTVPRYWVRSRHHSSFFKRPTSQTSTTFGRSQTRRSLLPVIIPGNRLDRVNTGVAGCILYCPPLSQEE